MKGNASIQELAYELFEKSGGIHGRDLDHWLEAERIIAARRKDMRAKDVEAVTSKKRMTERSDARWHESKKAGRSGKAK